MVDGFILAMGFALIFSFTSSYFLLDETDSKGAIIKSFFFSIAIFLLILVFLIIS
ncbi:MAG: hypothetical protein PHT91_01250 [Candidatus Nanoarchaeia archaeon]|nr:hypothetical protein [Candidatus Nanoarchaeia archaeon]MDD5054115.1 hypothetical protein [Candidatus Nanoarchaeia archaeon]MDD5499485.1 hypothetical protein [Candidatus Nanoarchaeia archaeon]